MKQRNLNLFLLASLLVLPQLLKSQTTSNVPVPDKLVVLWTSGEPDIAERVALMYTHNAKKAGWFKEVTLIVWGPSQKLVLENSEIREKVKEMQKDGVVVEACIACANSYGIAEDLLKLGYDVKGMGKPLTGYLKSGIKVLTF